MKNLMKAPVMFDGRNIYDPRKMKDAGIAYHSIGRGEPPTKPLS